jgi:hypothetical protein
MAGSRQAFLGIEWLLLAACCRSSFQIPVIQAPILAPLSRLVNQHGTGRQRELNRLNKTCGGGVPTSRAFDTALFVGSFSAFLSDKVQHRPKPLVTDDFSLIRLRELVELAVGEISTLMADLDASIRIIDDGDGPERDIFIRRNGDISIASTAPASSILTMLNALAGHTRCSRAHTSSSRRGNIAPLTAIILFIL